MKLLIFINLASGIADGSSYDLIRSFAQAEDEITIRYADQNSNFPALVSDATKFDAVVVCGGDGTLSTILYELRNTGVPVLPFPAGTANLLTQNLASPIDAPALANMIRKGRIIDCDMGELEYGDKKVGFSLMAGCGYDATIMKSAEPNKKFLGQLAYFTSAFTNPLPQVSSIKLEIDGETIESEGIGVLAMNFSKINIDLSLHPSSKPNDGFLDVMLMKTDTAIGLLPAFIGAAVDQTGKLQEHFDSVKFFKGKEVSVTADPPLPIQYDGEPVDGTTPLVIRVIPNCIKLIVSEETYKELA